MALLRTAGTALGTFLVICAVIVAASIMQPSYAGASTPYTLTSEGISLPSGATFRDNGHVNLRLSAGGPHVNAHFESKCINRTDAECAGQRHVFAQYIGKSFIPWSAFGLSGKFCVSWVQISEYNEHYGEGGEKPFCVPVEEPPTTPPASPPTETVTITPPTVTVTEPGKTITETVTETVTPPVETVTVTEPAETKTLTETATVTEPAETITETEKVPVPGDTVTVVEETPGPTVTQDVPGDTVTETLPPTTVTETLPPTTETVTQDVPGETTEVPGDTRTVTQDVPGDTITETTTQAVPVPGTPRRGGPDVPTSVNAGLAGSEWDMTNVLGLLFAGVLFLIAANYRSLFRRFGRE